jgi:hypothetical protein
MLYRLRRNGRRFAQQAHRYLNNIKLYVEKYAAEEYDSEL